MEEKLKKVLFPCTAIILLFYYFIKIAQGSVSFAKKKTKELVETPSRAVFTFLHWVHSTVQSFYFTRVKTSIQFLNFYQSIFKHLHFCFGKDYIWIFATSADLSLGFRDWGHKGTVPPKIKFCFFLLPVALSIHLQSFDVSCIRIGRYEP